MWWGNVFLAHAEYQGCTPGMPAKRGGFCGNSLVRTAVEGCGCPGAGAAQGIEECRGARHRVRTRVCLGDGEEGAEPQGSSCTELPATRFLCVHSAWLLLDHRVLIWLHLALVEAQNQSSCLGFSLQKWSIRDVPRQLWKVHILFSWHSIECSIWSTI